MSTLKVHTLFLIATIWLGVLEGARNYCGSNICGNTKQHTLCKFQSREPAKHCLDFEITLRSNEDRSAILDKINNRRNKVAAGELRSLPASANMVKLEWNTELEVFAQRWANQCAYNSLDSRDTCRDLDNVYVGQNVASIYGESPGLTVTALVDVWYMELLSINESVLSRFRGSKNSGFNHYEYFSQLVWADSREVGCGSVRFKDRDNGNRTVYRLVCNFMPGGNRVNQSVYSYGRPCSRCPADTACDPVYKALCGTTRQPRQLNKDRSIKDETVLEYKTTLSTFATDITSNTDTTTATVDKETMTDNDDNITPFDYFSHVHDFTRQLVTATATKHDCKDILSVDNFVDILREKLSSDPALKELLLSTKMPTISGFVDTSFADASVAAFVRRLYSKKQFMTTTKATESDLLNSTLLVDLVEAVIFRSNGGVKFHNSNEEHTTLFAFDVSPVKVQAELAKVQQNSDFTGHYFFPEEVDDETETEATEAYYDTSNIPIQDVMMEIKDLKKTTVTIDFLDEIFEEEPAIESTTTVRQLSPDDMNIYKSGHNVMKKFLEDITDKTPTQMPF